MEIKINKKQAMLLWQLVNNAQHHGVQFTASLVVAFKGINNFDKMLSAWNEETNSEFLDLIEIKEQLEKIIKE